MKVKTFKKVPTDKKDFDRNIGEKDVQTFKAEKLLEPESEKRTSSAGPQGSRGDVCR